MEFEHSLSKHLAINESSNQLAIQELLLEAHLKNEEEPDFEQVGVWLCGVCQGLLPVDAPRGEP